MNYTTVTDLKWANPDDSQITCMVDFETLGVVPFTACGADEETHCVEIYNRCIAGDFGPIAPYVAPVISNEDQIKAQIVALESTVTPRREREALLTVNGKEWLQGVDDQIAALRAALRAQM